MLSRAITEFLRLESAVGILLFVCALAALAMVNSPLEFLYQGLLTTPIAVQVGNLQIAKPLLLWINDGLMAVFFLLVGLELKREILEGELSEPAQVALPAAAALGGMAAPALIYVFLNRHNGIALQGWAIPCATDIAFALGVLALLGRNVPSPLKLFLLTLAIIDDLGAIIIIAVFYSGDLSVWAFALAAVLIAALAVMNWRGVTTVSPYILVGVLLWVAVLKSGIHATLAGVVLAMFIPMRNREDPQHSPLRQLENDLHPAVAFGILPAFAFANAGVPLAGITPGTLLGSVPLGIGLGLFIGNQAGILLTVWLAVRLGFARLPEGVNWLQMYGLAMLCGIGFTMSLFIGSLAFEHAGPAYPTQVRLGILMGSLLSGCGGYTVLRFAGKSRAAA